MIEAILRDYMEEELDGVPVYLQIPADKPTRYVVLEKTGSSLRNHLYDTMIAVQSYAESMYAAAELSETVVETMLNSVALDEIAGVLLNSEYNYTEPGTAQYRYQAVFDLNHY